MTAIFSIREMCDLQARKARESYDAKMASYVWERIDVYYNDSFQCWVVFAVNNPKHDSFSEGSEWGEALGDFRLRKDAIEEAKLYAFSTDCGPMRAPVVDIFRKDGMWMDSIHPRR